MSIFLTKRDLFPKLISVFKLLEAKLQEEALDERQPIK